MPDTFEKFISCRYIGMRILFYIVMGFIISIGAYYDITALIIKSITNNPNNIQNSVISQLGSLAIHIILSETFFPILYGMFILFLALLAIIFILKILIKILENNFNKHSCFKIFINSYLYSYLISSLVSIIILIFLPLVAGFQNISAFIEVYLSYLTIIAIAVFIFLPFPLEFYFLILNLSHKRDFNINISDKCLKFIYIIPKMSFIFLYVFSLIYYGSLIYYIGLFFIKGLIINIAYFNYLLANLLLVIFNIILTIPAFEKYFFPEEFEEEKIRIV
ncbi:hypothetical protein YN1_7900 [Nanoarchaeota archaeon]